MNRQVGFSASDKVIYDIKGLIIELKNIYFPEKKAFDDDQVLVQKLCVQLEKALRYGAREKYTFLGTRKDYWNYISDCLPKDEAVRFVQSITEIKTNQGKGRAVIRQALMEKTLADTLQRCVINERLSKEYYLVDSIVRNDQHFQNLIHLLYDLNSIDFNLPYKGYDLDRSWPAFSRKSFGEDKRHRSISSVSEQSAAEEDPLVILHSVTQGLLKSLSSWKGEPSTMRDQNNDSSPITLSKIIELLIGANEDVITAKMTNESLVDSLKVELNNCKQKNEKLIIDHESQIKHIHNRYLMLQQTDKSSEQLKDVFEKLLQTELELNNLKTENDSLKISNEEFKLLKEKHENENISLQNELLATVKEVEGKDASLQNLILQNETLNNELKELRLQKSTMENKSDGVDGDIMEDDKTSDISESVVNEMNVFIEDIIAVLSEISNDENTSALDSEDGIFKKSKAKKAKKLKQALEGMPEVKIAKEEREAVLEKLVELKKEIIVSRQEKGDYQKEVIALKCDLDTVSKDLDELKVEKTSRQVHRHIMKEKETNTDPKPKQMTIAVSTDVNPLEVEEEETLKVVYKIFEKPFANFYARVIKEEDDLKAKCSELEGKLCKMTADFEKCNQEIINMSLNASKLNKTIEEKDDEIEKLIKENERIKDLNQHNSKLNDELVTVHYDLESSQKLIDKLKSELQDIVEMKENDMKTLKFETSTIEMKYECVLKELAELTSKHNDALSELSVHEEHLKLMESRRTEENSSWASEKDQLVLEKQELEKELESLKETSKVAEKEVKFLKLEVSKLAKEKEGEKDIRSNLNNRMQNMIEERKALELKFQEELDFLTTENSEMREHLVNITKDKHDLWRRKEVLEVELKTKSDERWVSDDEVKECTNCKQAFTMTLRKHHCRLCGHIFCHACSNRWIRTHHSRKRVRSCNVCADSYEDTHKDTVDGADIVDGSANDTMSDRSSFLGTDDFDESADLTQSDDKLVTDAFEILDPANVSSSGSFGESEVIKVVTTDMIQSPPVVPTVQNAADSELEKEIFDVSITAGQRYFIPIIVGSSQFQLIWEFSSTPKDIGFGIAYKANEEEDDENIQTIIPLSRYISHKQTIHGKMMVVNPGLYYLVFDNSFSRLTTKSVSCSIHLSRS